VRRVVPSHAVAQNIKRLFNCSQLTDYTDSARYDPTERREKGFRRTDAQAKNADAMHFSTLRLTAIVSVAVKGEQENQ
jgi:hypothetical protein